MPAPNGWENVEITIRARPFLDVHGNPIPASIMPYPLRIGTVMRHWAKPAVAMAWLAVADVKLNDTAKIDDLTRRGSATAQFAYLKSILSAFCNACDALNVVWWNIPQARAVYRKWNSGMPADVGGRWDQFQFDSDKNYGGVWPNSGTAGWYVMESDPALIHDLPTGGSAPIVRPGILAGLARRLFVNYYPPGGESGQSFARQHPNLFIPTVGFSLRPLPSAVPPAPALGTPDSRPLAVEMARDVQNNYWLMLGSHTSCEPVSSYPKLCDWNDWQTRGGVVVGSDGRARPHVPYVDTTLRVETDLENSTTMDPPGTDTWMDFRFGQALSEITSNVWLPASLGPGEYIPYLREMVAALLGDEDERRDPIARAKDLIQDSRANVIYQNTEAVRHFASGGLEGYLAAAFGTPADVYRQWIVPNAMAHGIATAAYTVGGLLAPATSGISAVIGGAVGATLDIVGTLIRGPVTSHGKDDLGRYKPIYERAWLSGQQNPNDPNLDWPMIQVPDPPPGFLPIPGDRDQDLRDMRITCAQYLALSRADRFVYVGSLLQTGPYSGSGERSYTPPSDPAEGRRIGQLVDALNAHCVRVGFSRAPTNVRPQGTPPCPGCGYDDGSMNWGPWIVGGLLVASLWKIFVG